MNENHAEQAIITSALLHRLLNTTAADARLVLTAGHVEVRTGPDIGDGGLVVITRTDLVDQVGDPPDDRALAEQAALLDSNIGLMGA
ncbi:hypothetical protein ACFXK0_06545 [Nocardia sp. NPDC059177]|uniref:hypothetical protein n=1 Tax=Nocardia sp. NPDC059177 TaxID=3346759 RepID=UPI0036C52ABF